MASCVKRSIRDASAVVRDSMCEDVIHHRHEVVEGVVANARGLALDQETSEMKHEIGDAFRVDFPQRTLFDTLRKHTGEEIDDASLWLDRMAG